MKTFDNLYRLPILTRIRHGSGPMVMLRHCPFSSVSVLGIVALLIAAFGVSCTSQTQNPVEAGPPGTRSSSAGSGVVTQEAKDRSPVSRTPATEKRASSQESSRGSAVKGLGESPRMKPAATDSRETRSGDRAEGQVRVERLSGYGIPTEYLVIPSRHFSDAVVAVALPVDYEKDRRKKYPLVIAFSGATECMKPPRQGSLAWIGDYKADEAVKALETGRLDKADFRGLATLYEVQLFNRMLQKHPYQGIILACPYSPPLPMGHGFEVKEYEDFIMNELIPALKSRYRVAKERVGVDGVSMGGARAMYYGFKYPDVFSTIGSVQGAFGLSLGMYTDLVKKKRGMLKDRSIQLVTSDRDTMARSVERMHQMLEEQGIPHQYLKLTGPHDYIFNQGPGSLALLVFHNRGPRVHSSGPVR